jgi:Flp pilus assembly pilin Flp
MIKLQKNIIALWQGEDGAAAVEFALIAPVFLFMLLGAFDIGHTVYMRSILDGALQQAARDAALESAARDPALGEDEENPRLVEIEEKLRKTVNQVSKSAKVYFTKESYFNFNDVDRAEIFYDRNNDGICNNGETFENENEDENITWDDDVGEEGIGGAKDIVQYNVKVVYPALFSSGNVSLDEEEPEGAPDSFDFMKFNGRRVLTSTSVLKNQPYSQQNAENTSVNRICT